MLDLLLVTTRKHHIIPISPMNTDRKSRDQVTDQELVAQYIIKHMMVATNV